MTAIDSSGIDTISELRKILEKQSLKVKEVVFLFHFTMLPLLFYHLLLILECLFVQFVLANPVGSVMEKLHQSNVLEAFGLEGLYLTVGEAVGDISSSWKPGV